MSLAHPTSMAELHTRSALEGFSYMHLAAIDWRTRSESMLAALQLRKTLTNSDDAEVLRGEARDRLLGMLGSALLILVSGVGLLWTMGPDYPNVAGLGLVLLSLAASWGPLLARNWLSKHPVGYPQQAAER